jgi:hypothetical protein
VTHDFSHAIEHLNLPASFYSYQTRQCSVCSIKSSKLLPRALEQMEARPGPSRRHPSRSFSGALAGMSKQPLLESPGLRLHFPVSRDRNPPPQCDHLQKFPEALSAATIFSRPEPPAKTFFSCSHHSPSLATTTARRTLSPGFSSVSRRRSSVPLSTGARIHSVPAARSKTAQMRSFADETRASLASRARGQQASWYALPPLPPAAAPCPLPSSNDDTF